MQDNDKAIQANRVRWNEVTPIHARSAWYRLEEFKRGASTLDPIALAEVGEVSGQSLLHLQCHFGLDTMSWARLGARVTGVDLADDAIDLARRLSQELDIEARFVRANLYDLPAVLGDRFDIVFSSWGVLCWLPDLPSWAGVVANHLVPGGFFYLLDGHPLLNLFDDNQGVTELRVNDRSGGYFHDPQPTWWPPGGDYADPTARTVSPSYEWRHSLGEIIGALTGAGLQIDFLHEHQVIESQHLPFLEQGPDRWWRLPLGHPAIPLSFSIKATMPGSQQER
jgi:SAM-dependent methyltransferase